MSQQQQQQEQPKDNVFDFEKEYENGRTKWFQYSHEEFAQMTTGELITLIPASQKYLDTFLDMLLPHQRQTLGYADIMSDHESDYDSDEYGYYSDCSC